MRLALTDEERALRSSAGGAVRSVWSPDSVRLDPISRDVAVRAVTARLNALGATELRVPGDVGAGIAVALELGQVLAPAAVLRHAVMAPEILRRCASEGAEDLVERICAGEVFVTVLEQGFAEGVVFGGRYADFALVMTQNKTAVEVHAVAMDCSAGCEVDPIDSCWDIRRWSPANDSGKPLGVLATTDLEEVRAAAAILDIAYATGSTQALMAMSVDYARARQQFGKPIGAQQAVQHNLATMATRCYLTECAVLAACDHLDGAVRLRGFAQRTSLDVAELAIQVHGAMGFTWECDVHLYLRNALASRLDTQGGTVSCTQKEG